MVLTAEERKQHQIDSQKRYRAKKGCYSEAQKNSIYKYLNKKRIEFGEQPIKPRIKKIIYELEYEI